MDGIVLYIGENFAESTFSLASVAEEFGMNASYLSRKFKREVGVGFGEYVQTVRLESAQRLLRETDRPVSEAAEFVGYHSASAFKSVFNKTAGMSPAVYRRGGAGCETSI